MVRIQRALETDIVKENLGALGLTPQEINQRLEGLSDEQLHTLAQSSDRVLAGGDGGKVGIAVLLIILIVVLIMYFMHRKIIIK